MNKRQNHILDLLAQQGEIVISLLAKQLNVSEMTVYRDINYLENEGLLVRKRGAIIYVNKDEPTAVDRYAAEKLAIAREAVKLINEGDAVIFDNSTTALEVAKLCIDFKSLTVYATNVDVVCALRSNPGIALYCSGGYYSHSSTGFVGSASEEFVERVRANKCIVGTSGISAVHGLTCPYPSHASLQRKIVESVHEVIVVADHTKFGRAAIEKIAELSRIDYLVTDSAATEDNLKEASSIKQIILAQM